MDTDAAKRSEAITSQAKAKMANPNAHHPIVLGLSARDMIASTNPIKAQPHPAHPQHTPPMKLHAAPMAAKQIAMIPKTYEDLSFLSLAVETRAPLTMGAPPTMDAPQFLQKRSSGPAVLPQLSQIAPAGFGFGTGSE